MKDLVFSNVHEASSTVDASPLMFVRASILCVHALQYTSYIDSLFVAPHSDCGVEDALGEAESSFDVVFFFLKISMWLGP